jgi:uncharacterized membrane protein
MPWLYLDPGSGSLLIQLLIAALAGLMIFFGTNWRKIKRMFRKNKDQNNESDREDGDEDEED